MRWYDWEWVTIILSMMKSETGLLGSNSLLSIDSLSTIIKAIVDGGNELAVLVISDLCSKIEAFLLRWNKYFKFSNIIRQVPKSRDNWRLVRTFQLDNLGRPRCRFRIWYIELWRLTLCFDRCITMFSTLKKWKIWRRVLDGTSELIYFLAFEAKVFKSLIIIQVRFPSMWCYVFLIVPGHALFFSISLIGSIIFLMQIQFSIHLSWYLSPITTLFIKIFKFFTQ